MTGVQRRAQLTGYVLAAATLAGVVWILYAGPSLDRVVLPAVIFVSLGYLIGRFTYFATFRRTVLRVPPDARDGLRKVAGILTPLFWISTVAGLAFEGQMKEAVATVFLPWLGILLATIRSTHQQVVIERELQHLSSEERATLTERLVEIGSRTALNEKKVLKVLRR